MEEHYHNINVRLITKDYIPDFFIPKKKGVIPALSSFFYHFIRSLNEDLYAVYKFFVPNGYIPPVLYPFNYADEGNQLARAVWRTEAISQEEILLDLIGQYEEYPEMRFVVSSIDYGMATEEEAWINYPTQLYELGALKPKYQDRIIPLVCVDPRRYQGGELVNFVKNNILRGFGGVTMYPELGFRLDDPALADLYTSLKKYDIPVIIYFNNQWMEAMAHLVKDDRHELEELLDRLESMGKEALKLEIEEAEKKFEKAKNEQNNAKSAFEVAKKNKGDTESKLEQIRKELESASGIFDFFKLRYEDALKLDQDAKEALKEGTIKKESAEKNYKEAKEELELLQAAESRKLKLCLAFDDMKAPSESAVRTLNEVFAKVKTVYLDVSAFKPELITYILDYEIVDSIDGQSQSEPGQSKAERLLFGTNYIHSDGKRTSELEIYERLKNKNDLDKAKLDLSFENIVYKNPSRFFQMDKRVFKV